MTTGNDPAQPAPNDQTDVTITASGGEPGPLKITSIEEIVDPDEIELRDAKAAVQTEDAAAQTPPADQVTGAQSAPPAPPQAQAPASPPQDPVMIPKARFDEVNNARTEAERQAAYYKGLADARQAPASPQAPPAPAQPSAEQRLSALHEQQDALAARFDNGEITRVEETKQARVLAAEEQAIREEILLAKVPKPQAQAPVASGNELYLETLTAQLETQHPWVQVFDKVGNDADWSWLKAQAIQNLQARNVDPRQGDMGKYELRKEIAVLADQFGPALLSGRAQAQGIPLPGQTSPSQGGQLPPQQQQPSRQAQARGAKLTLQENAPPNLNQVTGQAQGGLEDMSDSRIEAMSEDEIGALPTPLRNKLLGIEAA